MMTHRRAVISLGLVASTVVSRMSVALAAVIAVSAFACGPTVPVNDTPDAAPVQDQLVLSPPAPTVDVTNGNPVVQAFTAKLVHGDGTSEDVTATTTFSIDSVYGSFLGPTLSATGPGSGVATIQASNGVVEGSAQITIYVHITRLDSSAPIGADSMFTGGTVNALYAPGLVYPDDQIVVPNNLGGFEVHWSDTQGNEVFELSMVSTYADLRVYYGGSPPYFFDFTPDDWTAATTMQNEFAFNVRGVSSNRPGMIGAGTARVAKLTNEPISGGMYYWATEAADGVSGVFRHDLSQPTVPAEAFATPQSTSQACVGCHALSHDGTQMSITFGGDGPGTIMNVATETYLPANNYWNMATFTADDSKLITVTNGQLNLRNVSDASIVGEPIVTNGYASDPDLSHSGTMMAYALAQTGESDFQLDNASIMTMSYDPTTNLFGAPVPLITQQGAENNYYPSWSPDDQWMLFTKSTADSYNASTSELWVVKADGTQPPIKLTAANLGPGLTNSWSRWAPFQQTVGASAEAMYWITFSSSRPFGVRLPNVGQPQIWMAPFYPDRAAALVFTAGHGFFGHKQLPVLPLAAPKPPPPSL